jgi:hypothetical protein
MSCIRRNKRRDLSKRRIEIQNKDKDLEGATFKPKVNPRLQKLIQDEAEDVHLRLHKETIKRKEKLKAKQNDKEKLDKLNNTFTPKLIAKSRPRVIDSDDEDGAQNRTTHNRLYKKHFSTTRKKEELKKEYESEMIQAAPKTNADQYLSKLKSIYSVPNLRVSPRRELSKSRNNKENKKTINVTIKTTESDTVAKEEIKSYLETKNVHDRLFQHSLGVQSKKEIHAKKVCEERGIIFKPKITNYPLPAHKRRPLYVSPWKPSR